MSKRVPPLSPKAIAALKPVAGKTVELVDGLEPGLRCRMSPKGALSWSLAMRDAAGVMRRFSLDGPTGLADARQKAKEMRARVRAGGDPVAEKRAAREQAERTKQPVAESDTLGGVVELYFQKGPGAAHRTKNEMLRTIRTVFASELKRVATGATPASLILCLDRYRAPVAANRAVQYMRPILKWAAKRKYLAAGENWLDVTKPHKENPVQRVLTRDELATLLPVFVSYVSSDDSGGCARP